MADLTDDAGGKILMRFEPAGTGTQPQHLRQRFERMLDIAPADERAELKHAGPCRKLLYRLQTWEGIAQIDSNEPGRGGRFQHSVVRWFQFANQLGFQQCSL